MSRTVLRTLLRSALLLATAASINAGCSRQAEGERCDLEWAGPTQDCDTGLVCVPCGDLFEREADRCCPADGTYSDSHCQPSTTPDHTTCSTRATTAPPPTGGDMSTAGAGGEAPASGI